MHDDEPRDVDEGEELEAEMLRADRPAGTDRFGTTAEEQLSGEGLDRALGRERPEEPDAGETLSLVDGGLADAEDELVGDDESWRDEFSAPEEAAVSVRDDAPGATDHDDPHDEDDVNEDAFDDLDEGGTGRGDG